MYFVKYPKIKRIVSDGVTSKKLLTSSEIDALLDGEIVVEEKIDGGICGVSWRKDAYMHYAQGRGRVIQYTENSKPFYGFNKWIYSNYEKIQKIPDEHIIYGEWMGASHNIYYDLLPDYFIAFDVWNNIKNKFLSYTEKTNLLERLEFSQVPLLFQGPVPKHTKGHSTKDDKILDVITDMVTKSKYSTNQLAEGVVVKNYKKNKLLMGKYVRQEFSDSLDEHWLKMPLRKNGLAEEYENEKKETKKTK